MSKIKYLYDAVELAAVFRAKNVCRVKWRKKFKWRVTIALGNRKNYEANFYCFGQAIKHAREMRLNLYGEYARGA